LTEVNIVDSDCEDEPLKRLNNKFDDVVHIGNSLRSDIKPAEKVGIDAIHIKNSDWIGDYEIKNNSNVWQVDNLIQAANILENKYKNI
jgi:FMN phosphatase YigB (HAD superfamily)